MRKRILMVATVAALGLGIAPTVFAQTLYFGDAAAPAGVFELTSGALTGPNYYRDDTNAAGASPPGLRVNLGNLATVSHTAADPAFTSPGVSVGTFSANPTVPAIAYPDEATLNITGGSVSTTGGGNDSFLVGDGSNGTLNLSGGTVTVGGRFAVGTGGAGSGGSASATVSGAGSLLVNGTAGIQVGPGQVTTASFTLSGGSATVSNGGFGVGQGASDNHSVSVSGGTLTVNGGILRVGDSVNSSGNTFDQSGGLVDINGVTAAGESLIIGAAGSPADSSQGSYTLSGGTLDLAGTAQVGNNGSGSFTASGGILTIGNNLVVANFLDGDGLFTVDGSGAAISVAGVLAVSSGNPPQPTATGGAGTLSFLADNGVSGVSLISVLGAATLGDADSLASILLDITADASPNSVYNLVLAVGGFNGGLANVSPSLPAGYFLQIIPQIGGSGQVLQAVFVPEPATWALAAVALMACGLRRRSEG